MIVAKKRILVFPCGSEVALEIYRSLKYSAHFELIGASSVDDHGRFVFENYHGGLPYHYASDFISTLRTLVRELQIDAIYPAMDAVASTLAKNVEELGCKVIGSSASVSSLCASKQLIYEALKDIVKCPTWTTDLTNSSDFPIFMKPDVGYGSRHAYKIENIEEAQQVLMKNPQVKFLFCEYLPGREFTIDCFSDKHGELLFSGARVRERISNGISVRTISTNKHSNAFKRAAEAINASLNPRGAWFFQMKENADGEPVLLEVAARLGGSSSYFRAKGVNFALLSAFDTFDIPVSVSSNSYDVILDRALGSSYLINMNYSKAYIDFDDCLLINGQVNLMLVQFLFQCLNRKISLTLITRHEFDIHESLTQLRLNAIFDEVIHLKNGEKKSDFIDSANAIFIDDSHRERKDVQETHGIPVFSPDMVEVLIG